MKVVNFGSLNIDRVYEVEDFSGPGQTIMSKSYGEFLGGKGLNQSVALSKAGADVTHAGVIGVDGAILRDALSDNSVKIHFLRQSPSANGHAIIQIDKTGQNSIIVAGGSNQEVTVELIDEVFDSLNEPVLVLTQNEVSNVPYIISKAKEKGHLVAFNASPLNEGLKDYPFDLIDVVLINETEGEYLCGESDPYRILEELHQKYPNLKIVLTLGAAGVLFLDGDTITKQDGFKVTPVDTTGAGDCFTGFFLAGWLREEPIADVLATACKASAISITVKGATNSIPTLSQVKGFTV
ncbi:MAG: ribokinase [Erysipelotrichaceae bacterium]|jgi:ribokinase|nr:ribokinase [Erysipelotrichaceae bacterium]